MNEENEKYRFPQTLNQPKRLFGLQIDEAFALLIPIAVGFWFKYYVTGLIIGGIFMFILKTLKRGKPSSYLYNSLYWYLPSNSTGVIYKKLPPSHLRFWIK